MTVTVGSPGSGEETVTVSIRPVCDADEAFLQQVFLAGRPELRPLPASLVQLQRQAQRAQYDAAYPGNVDHLIFAGQPVGRCWLWRAETEHRLLDIAVLDRYRGQGIGRSVLAQLAEAADRAGVPLRLSVWSANAIAVQLYRSAGFEQYDEANGYLHLHRLPTAG